MTDYTKKIGRLQQKLTPISQKIEGQRHLASIKKGMMDLTIILLIGSIFTMLLFLSQLNWFGASFLSRFQEVWQRLIHMTYGLLGLYLSISISFHHSKQLNTPRFYSVFLSSLAVIISHYAFSATDHLADIKLDNLFISLIISLVTVELVAKINRERSKGASWIPAGSRKTMNEVLTACIYLLVIYGGLYRWRLVTSGSFLSQGLTTLMTGMDTPLFIFVIILLEMLFWFIGLNGYSILAAIVLPITTNQLVLNTELIAAGKRATHIFTPNFWDFFAGMSGSGLVGSLAVLALFSKVDSLKAKGRVAIIPSLFHISEPILYGLPIAYNPYFFVPFVIGTPCLAVGQWYIFKWGMVQVPAFHVADLPVPVAQLLSTMDWRALIVVIVVFILGGIMYYPFFKLYEKQVISTELAAEKDHRFDDLDLDF